MNGGAKLRGSLDHSKQNAAEFVMDELALSSPNGDLHATVEVQSSPLRARAVARMSRLDASGVLRRVEPPEEGALSEDLRNKVRDLGVDVDVSIARMSFERFNAEAVHFAGTLRSGTLVAQSLNAKLFGGTVDARGSKLDLAAKTPRLELKLRAKDIDAANATQQLSGQPSLKGKFSLSAKVTAEGSTYGLIRQTMTGGGTFEGRNWSVQKGPVVSTLANIAVNNKFVAGDFHIEGGQVKVDRPMPATFKLPEPGTTKRQARER
jgi:uncharacterized protein involved in outer membrane biogenesis